ncbi:MAG: class I SAM-dependent methyltransferase [Gammaproteobacteria bacterium]|nr:MAG: class I SAM-dependent methyltransferase [Gammaproteobacteria bacterium]
MASPYLSADIANNYLPQRTHYWYARCKLASDLLYTGVGEALLDTHAPLLDLGCGIGLLAHTLRGQGYTGEYFGVDNDAEKIVAARAAAARAQFPDVRFDCIDLAREAFPAHRGSVTLLDLLQFLPRDAAHGLIDRVAECIAPGARLVIRTGLDQAGARMHFTRAIDTLARAVGWMNTAAYWYPSRDELATVLARRGLRATFAPLSGMLPFNNWLVVAQRT